MGQMVKGSGKQQWGEESFGRAPVLGTRSPGGHQKPQQNVMVMVVGHPGHRGFDHVHVLLCIHHGQKVTL